ncbi:Sec-independent protein translocase TatC [Jatrophihabitans endophyticus]|uniref:Sec-independent protein translocase protein TatC n=1 Tax=Jatrophihabitans endophyticus TaxID=1206085 RepID=A0A1M5MU89_9ACTN|nr:twin-arginine translocase subunit TatC [Jatrophihabitans endophyticus]SHG80856.1 Sec-independent protein translocase TatC [Jatrophihabitans endophyticus]
MPVMDHLRELRRRIVAIVVIVAVGGIVGWFFYISILDFLKDPYCAIPSEYRAAPTASGECVLVYHGALDGFTTRLKVSAIAGAVLTGPFWLYQIWAFITPGLRRNERRYTLLFVAMSTILFAAGMSLAYVVLGKGLKIIIEGSGSGTAAQLTVSDYISFVTLLLVTFGAAFELPLILVLANFAGALPAKWLKKSQRVAIFLIFLFAGVATPTADPFTMCAMAIPMVILFEVAVLVAHVHDKRKAARRAAERAEPHLEDHVPSSIDPIPQPLDSTRQVEPRRTDVWSDIT